MTRQTVSHSAHQETQMLIRRRHLVQQWLPPSQTLQILQRYISSAGYRPATIFAPATGKGKTAISILRISGEDALTVWHRMTAPPTRFKPQASNREPVARKAELRRIVHPDTGETLDEGIVLYFPGPSQRCLRQSSTNREAQHLRR